ncbi:MAG: hypothetical protein QME66_07215 [Candidatus Eisenbacteria bacterium]|nr:hypothetical protein [Candidatus Eisenbacteria bacterium]
MEVKYEPISSDPKKSCKNCESFEAKANDEKLGLCFGIEVSSSGTCNMFSPRK